MADLPGPWPRPLRRFARWGVWAHWRVGERRTPARLRWAAMTRRAAEREARRLECDPAVLSAGIGAVERTGHIGFVHCEVKRLV